jgi:predicted nucleic acid-binding protein
MPARVADASVLAAWFFVEPNHAEAGELLAGFELYAPALLVYELTNVAWVKTKQMPALADKIADALSAAMRFEISMLEVEPRPLLATARRFEVTAYDAAYLCVAATIGCPLVTFDRRLARAAAKAGLGILA